MNNIKYLKVDLSLYGMLSGDELIFLSYLKFLCRKLKSDDRGYINLDSGYIERSLGMDRQKIRRYREHLVKLKVVDYIPGRNQNQKPRYRVL